MTEPGSSQAPAALYRNRLLALIALILCIGGLRIAYPIAMPIVFAGVIIAVAWPLKLLFDRWIPSWASYALTILTLLGGLAAFAAAVYFSLGQVLAVLFSQWPKLQHAYAGLADAATRWGIPLDRAMDQRRATTMVEAVVTDLYSFLTYLGFVAILVVLGLPEVPRLRDRLREELGRRTDGRLVEILSGSSKQIRGYLGTTLVTSLLTGIASTLFSLAVGLDLALVWGLLNFLLNFIPVIGNIIGIMPPVLYAFVQFGGYSMPLIVLGGFALLQISISNFVYPVLQGRQLSISPVAIIVAMAFWSWMWGIAGALIAVPLTAALAILCRQFERTRWISTLISVE